MGLNFEDSLQKFHYVLRLCEELDVHVKPVKISGNLWIVPLFAWYTPEFDKKWDGEFAYRVRAFPAPSPVCSCSPQRQWLDFRACHWPDSLKEEPGAISAHFLDMNKEA